MNNSNLTNKMKLRGLRFLIELPGLKIAVVFAMSLSETMEDEEEDRDKL